MLLPMQLLSGEHSWDTARYATLAQSGGRVTDHCVKSEAQGGQNSGGLIITGDNDRMVMVLYAPWSEFDNQTTSRIASGLPLGMKEPPPKTQPLPPQSDDSNEEVQSAYTGPPATKRLKTDPNGWSTAVGFSSAIQHSLSAGIASGWWLNYNAVKSIFPVANAARELIAFYNFVTAKAAAQLHAGAAELESLAFRLGAVALVMNSSDIIYWDWIVDFAMAMVDSTSTGNPIQYAFTVVNPWQQNTIKIELFLGGTGADESH
ncbi:MAG: hypothetical protein Q9170_007176 [Blastenia crenularia]